MGVFPSSTVWYPSWTILILGNRSPNSSGFLHYFFNDYPLLLLFLEFLLVGWWNFGVGLFTAVFSVSLCLGSICREICFILFLNLH